MVEVVLAYFAGSKGSQLQAAVPSLNRLELEEVLLPFMLHSGCESECQLQRRYCKQSTGTGCSYLGAVD